MTTTLKGNVSGAMNLDRRTFLHGAGAFAAATAAFSGGAFAQDASIRRIPTGIAAGLDTSPLFAAIDQGIFRDHNIVITPNIFFSGVELINTAASGQSLISVVGVTVLSASIDKGIPLKIISLQHGSPVGEYYTTARAIAREGSGIVQGDIASLKGKTIGTPLGTDGELGALAYLSTVGLTKADVNLVQVARPDMVGAMTSGSVDAVVFVAPWPTVVETMVPGAFRLTPEQPPLYSPGIIVASHETIATKRDLLKDFLVAAAAGQQWARANTAELIEINSRWTQIPKDVATKAITQINFDMRVSKRTLTRFTDVSMPDLVKLGIITAPITMDNFIDASIMKEVQEDHAELFSDLPPIAAEDTL